MRSIRRQHDGRYRITSTAAAAEGRARRLAACQSSTDDGRPIPQTVIGHVLEGHAAMPASNVRICRYFGERARRHRGRHQQQADPARKGTAGRVAQRCSYRHCGETERSPSQDGVGTAPEGVGTPRSTSSAAWIGSLRSGEPPSCSTRRLRKTEWQPCERPRSNGSAGFDLAVPGSLQGPWLFTQERGTKNVARGYAPERLASPLTPFGRL
jgi:hypothetical protein